MKNYYDEVKQILTKWPQTRDNDMLLWGQFLFIKGFVTTQEKFFDVLSRIKSDRLPSFESVSRARRKVQELEPDLRGKRYSQRKHEEKTYHDFYRDN